MTLSLRRASNRAAVSLGEMLGQGGEGAVYPVKDGADLVAKIYHEAPAPSKVEKLAAMTRTAVPAVLRVAAWPVDLLIDETDTVRGFLMPKVAAREDAHELYSPKSRRQAFPRADFRFVVRAGANLARAVATMHLQGHVIGDINHGNALIGRDCTVVLIDCDSFQIRGDDERLFTCDVGVALFTPPELHGKTFRGLQRSTQHDGFGLAVLIFHLLFAGRHPFAGRYSGGELTIEQAIAESRFAYGAHAASAGMSRPPAALALNAFGAQIADLFERAFAKPAEPEGAGRPAAIEWVAALERLEATLQRCPAVPLHFHPRDAACCWCDIEAIICMPLFGPADVGLTIPAPHLQNLWNAIEAIPRPLEENPQAVAIARSSPPARPKPSYSRPRESRGFEFPTIGWVLIGGGFILAQFLSLQTTVAIMAIIGLGIALQGKPRADVELPEDDEDRYSAQHEALRHALLKWDRLTAAWGERCSTRPFVAVMEELEAARSKLARLGDSRTARLAELREKAAFRKRDEYLQQFPVSRFESGRFGEEELATLAMHGVHNAADVINALPTLYRYVGDPLAQELTAWSQQLADTFDASSMTLEAHEVATVDEDLREERQELLERLYAGPAELAARSTYIAQERQKLKQSLDAAWAEVESARREVQKLDA